MQNAEKEGKSGGRKRIKRGRISENPVKLPKRSAKILRRISAPVLDFCRNLAIIGMRMLILYEDLKGGDPNGSEARHCIAD